MSDTDAHLNEVALKQLCWKPGTVRNFGRLIVERVSVEPFSVWPDELDVESVGVDDRNCVGIAWRLLARAEIIKATGRLPTLRSRWRTRAKDIPLRTRQHGQGPDVAREEWIHPITKTDRTIRTVQQQLDTMTNEGHWRHRRLGKVSRPDYLTGSSDGQRGQTTGGRRRSVQSFVLTRPHRLNQLLSHPQTIPIGGWGDGKRIRLTATS